MPRIDRPVENLLNHQPAGKPLSEILLKEADNDVSAISWFKERAGAVVPFLKVRPSPVEDPKPRDKITDIQAGISAADFGKKVDEMLKPGSEIRNYLMPKFNGDLFPSHFKHNAVTAQRIRQFLGELKTTAQEEFQGADLSSALKKINTAYFDLRCRELIFDQFESSGYWSFGHDATFLHAWEKRLEHLNDIDTEMLVEKGAMTPGMAQDIAREKKQLQNEIDAIFATKYVYHNSNMKEMDAEDSMGLVIIDRETRQRVSEKKATLDTITPKYEVLNVNVDGENKAIYYDVGKDKYFFDGTGQEVLPEILGANAANVQRRDVRSGNWTGRRANVAQGEHLRDGFRLNWNKDQYVQDMVISWVAWAGHCDIKAIMEAWGLIIPQGHEGVHEYDARSGKTVHYNRDLLNEKIASILEMSATSSSKFGGHRQDDEPDRIDMGTGIALPIQNRPNKFEVSTIKVKVDGEEKDYSTEDIFRKNLIQGDLRRPTNEPFKPNPLYDEDATVRDRIALRLGKGKVVADASVQVFNARGNLTMKNSKVTLDWSDPNAKPQLVDSYLLDANQRIMFEVTIDTANKKQVLQAVQFVKEGDKYVRKELDGRVGRYDARIERNIKPNEIIATHETHLDDPKTWIGFINEALETAKNYTSETARGGGVWNGRTQRLKQAKVWTSPDGNHALVNLDVDAKYGSNNGAFLVTFKPNGEIDEDKLVPVRMPFDFVWAQEPSFDPLGGNEETAEERGVITKDGRQRNADAIIGMFEILQAAFHDQNYLITKMDGDRVLPENRASFEAERTKYDDLREAAFDGAPPPDPDPVNGVLFEINNDEVKKGKTDTYKVKAEADGDVTIKLKTQLGDTDLTVLLPNGEKLTSNKWNLELDEVVAKGLKKGEEVEVRVYGYADGDADGDADNRYNLTVTGPKPGGVEPPPDRIEVEYAAELDAKELKHFDPITMPNGGTLKLQMEGDDNNPKNDMDLYWRFGEKPGLNNGEYEGRLYGPTSQESGTIQVPEGETVYFMMHSWGEHSTARVKITEE